MMIISSAVGQEEIQADLHFLYSAALRREAVRAYKVTLKISLCSSANYSKLRLKLLYYMIRFIPKSSGF